MSRYPLLLKVTPSTLAAWREDELASYEDHHEPEWHPHALLGRHAGQVEIRSEEESARLLASASHHGTRGCWDDRHAYRAAVERIAERLRQAETLGDDAGREGQ